MIPLRARIIARAHQNLVGNPVRSWRIGVGALLPLFLLGILVVIVIAGMLNPSISTATTLVIAAGVGVLLLLAYLVVADPRIVVCEHGVIIGRLVPGLPLSPTYVLNAREIDPRTICVVTNGPAAAREVGLPFFFFQFFTYPGAVGTPAVMFQGPWGSDVTTSRAPGLRGVNRKSLFLFSSRRARRIAEELLAMMESNQLLPEGFRPAHDLHPIPVTGRREDAVRQIPGAWLPDGVRQQS